MDLNIIKKIGFALCLGAGVYSISNLIIQLRQANEFMNLAKSCKEQINGNCEFLDENALWMLDLWDGNLNDYLFASIVFFLLMKLLGKQLASQSKTPMNSQE